MKSVPLDQEWVQLIMLAKQLGLTKNEIRDFLLREGIGTEKISG